MADNWTPNKIISMGSIGKGLVLFIVYLFLAGLVGWSSQMQLLFFIVAAIWWLA